VPAIDEERVVGGAGVLGHLDRGGPGDLVRLAVHEVGEREAGVEAMLLAGAALGCDGDGDRLRQDDLRLRRLVVEDQVHAEAPGGQALHAGLDLCEQVRAHPAQHVWLGATSTSWSSCRSARSGLIQVSYCWAGNSFLSSAASDGQSESMGAIGREFGSEKSGRAIRNFTWNVRGYPQPY
jgi:hypothetical protein